jgi:hypothetical protein
LVVKPESIVHEFGGRWLRRRDLRNTSGESGVFENGLTDVIRDIASGADIEFAELTPEPEQGDYGSAYLLVDGRLTAVLVMDTNVTVTYLGELWGGTYNEEIRIEEEILERTITYTHDRLPDKKLEYSYDSTQRGEERYAPLREKLREWSTSRR